MSRRHELRTSTGSDDDAQYLALVEALENLAHDKEVSMIVAAICLTMLGDTKTLTPRQIGIIKALGYKIVLAEQEEV